MFSLLLFLSVVHTRLRLTTELAGCRLEPLTPPATCPGHWLKSALLALITFSLECGICSFRLRALLLQGLSLNQQLFVYPLSFYRPGGVKSKVDYLCPEDALFFSFSTKAEKGKHYNEILSLTFPSEKDALFRPLPTPSRTVPSTHTGWGGCEGPSLESHPCCTSCFDTQLRLGLLGNRPR